MPHFITPKSKTSKSFHETLSNSTSEHRAEMGRGPEAPALEGSQSRGGTHRGTDHRCKDPETIPTGAPKQDGDQKAERRLFTGRAWAAA